MANAGLLSFSDRFREGAPVRLRGSCRIGSVDTGRFARDPHALPGILRNSAIMPPFGRYSALSSALYTDPKGWGVASAFPRLTAPQGAFSVKVAIFAGGKGSRLIEETTVRPKPLVEIGRRPLLWHIMQHYSVFGHHHFVLALGYMGSAIKKYIAELSQYEGNLRVDFTTREIYGQENSEGDFDVPNPPWMVDLIDTGVETMTGGRLQMLEPYLSDGTFMLTYGDGLSNVDLDKLVAFHKAHGRAATMTVVNPHTTFGHLQFDDDGRVLAFVEKPDTAKNLINGGFFVLEPRVFDIISDVTDATVMWEQGPLRKLMEIGELMAYQHPGFWSCCDHLADKRRLEAMWYSGERPWATWADADHSDKLIARSVGPGKLKFNSDDPGLGRGSHPANGCATARSEAGSRVTRPEGKQALIGLSGSVRTRSARGRREGRILLRAQPVDQPLARHAHIRQPDRGVLRHVTGQRAAFGQPHGQKPLRRRGPGVFADPVAEEAADPVEHLARLQVALGGGHDLDPDRPVRGQHRVPEKGRARHRNGRLQVEQVIGDVEGIERPLPHLGVMQELVDTGVVMGAEDIHPRRRLGAERVIHHAAKRPERVHVVEVQKIVDMAGMLRARHAALGHAHAGGIGHDGLFEGHLGAVGETGDHVGALVPLLREGGLGFGRAVEIDHALDVAADKRGQPQRLDPAIEVHLHAGLVAFADGVDHARRLGLLAQDGAERGVHLGVHRDEMLAALDRG